MKQEWQEKSWQEKNVQKFLGRHIFVRSAAQKRSTNNFLIRKLQLFLYTEFLHPGGNNPAQYSRKLNRNIKTTTTGKQSNVYFLTKYNIIYIIHINPHTSKNCKKSYKGKRSKIISQTPYFVPRFLSRHILPFFY